MKKQRTPDQFSRGCVRFACNQLPRGRVTAVDYFLFLK
jgi:hypothetical protein